MAKPTVAEQISDLEAELIIHKTSIKNQANLSEMEEGGSQASFRAKYDNTTLISRIKEIEVRLTELYASQNAGVS